MRRWVLLLVLVCGCTDGFSSSGAVDGFCPTARDFADHDQAAFDTAAQAYAIHSAYEEQAQQDLRILARRTDDAELQAQIAVVLDANWGISEHPWTDEQVRAMDAIERTLRNRCDSTR